MLDVPSSHPRAESLRIRERLVDHFHRGIVVAQGLIAHGRGEAFDYLFGEMTIPPAKKAIRAAAAALLLAKFPIISVNGNVAALTAKDVVKLAKELGCGVEVNLFYRSRAREKAIKALLEDFGAKAIFGVDSDALVTIPELSSERRKVDKRGILQADVVLLALEDGDRTEALVRMGKKVIAVDLNPLSRTAIKSTITIVDNVVRALPLLIKNVRELKSKKRGELKKVIESFDNRSNLGLCLRYITSRLNSLSRKG